MKTRSQYGTTVRSTNDDSVTALNENISNRLRRNRPSRTILKTRKSPRLHSTIPADNVSTNSNVVNTPTTSPVKNKLPKKSKNITKSKVCNFCFTDITNDYLLGDLRFSNIGITAHKFCLYFSPGLCQNDSLNSHFWGFRPKDIFKELKRGTSLKCSYCKKKGAVIGCSIPQCMVMFHLPCGIKNGSFNHYHQEDGLYPSYCKNHRPKMTVPAFKDPVLCTICQEYMKNSNRHNMTFIKCCNSYFHSKCLKEFTFHQGEFKLRCPNCNNEEVFLKTIKNAGFCIPEIGSNWQMPELPIPPVEFECSAAECRCENGRSYNGNDIWELFSCDRCGSSAIHIACANISNDTNMEWICEFCS